MWKTLGSAGLVLGMILSTTTGCIPVLGGGNSTTGTPANATAPPGNTTATFDVALDGDASCTDGPRTDAIERAPDSRDRSVEVKSDVAVAEPSPAEPAERADPAAALPKETSAKKDNEKEAVLYGSGYFEDNESCMVCHADFRAEPISKVHLENDVLCVDCHGDSQVHSGDEFNITRPDVLWGRAEIDAFCTQCHKKNEHPTGKDYQDFLAKWESKHRPNGRVVYRDSVCMDCHGNHAVNVAEGQFK